jgi:sarcosine oxidase subunit alpha
VWDADGNTFLPAKDLPPGMRVAGAANGAMTLAAALRQGHMAAGAVLQDLGLPEAMVQPPPRADDEPSAAAAFWYVPGKTSRAFVDPQNDVTVKDLHLAVQEGFSAVEHAKRYTTLGMGTDQGKTANVLAMGILAGRQDVPIAEIGTTVFRPPYTPVPIAAFAGRARGKDFRPVRLTPSHQWAMEQGAVFIEAGQWLRAQWFPRPGETHWRESVDREVRTTRSAVGVCDVTTLGKIEVYGADSAAFLNRVYANGFARLPVGRTRYGLMLREDGMAFDDGTTARLAEDRFVMTTTTANAAAVFRHLEFCRQCLWPSLDVHLVSVTEQWAQFAVAGPRSRQLLQKVIDPGIDLSNDAFPFMACRELTICNGTPARLFRISFSGELAYEIAVPARYGDSLIRVLMAAGEELGVTAYGTEALGVMRIEKGHAAGPELNGQTTARDLGMGRLVSPAKDSIGSLLSRRSELERDDGLALMGFVPVDAADTFAAGAHFLSEGAEMRIENDEGWMSSVAYSPSLGHTVGLGFISGGQGRVDEVVRAVDPVRGRDTRVRIVSPHFVDPDGERLRV